jgi:hypothetical protein
MPLRSFAALGCGQIEAIPGFAAALLRRNCGVDLPSEALNRG